MPRALITGVTGQDGLYLSELLIGQGYDVFGLVRGQNNPKRDLVEREVPGVKVLTGDLTDLSSLLRALASAQPDEVYNLGAISFVAYSWENARLTSEVTGLGVLNMLEATRLYCGDDVAKVRFYQASSSEMFGKVQQVPQSEATLLWPRSPYGVAKVFGHYMTINYRESYGMHASSGILFNHESPRRGPEFVTRKISQAVARISLGRAGLGVAGQPGCQARLGLRRRLRGRDVADAAGRAGRRLRGFHRRDAFDPGIPGHRLRPGGHRRLGAAGPRRPALLPSGRGGPADRRLVEGQDQPRLETVGDVPRTGHHDGRRRRGGPACVGGRPRWVAGDDRAGHRGVRAGRRVPRANLLARGTTVHGAGPRGQRRRRHRARIAGRPCARRGPQRRARLGRLIDEVEPDEIYNLAGISSVARSWAEPVATGRVSGLAVAGLLQAAWEHSERTGRSVAVVQASSAEIFGNPTQSPQDENTPIAPITPYGAAKAYAHHMVGVYRGRGLHAVSMILYNHESPRRPDTFVTRKITRRAAMIARGEAGELSMGNLDARRDWGWAPDYVEAMVLAARHPVAGDYVIATGQSHSVREFVRRRSPAPGSRIGSATSGSIPLSCVRWTRSS